MMSLRRTIRYAVGLAVVLSISAPVAAQARPDNLTWKGQDAGSGAQTWSSPRVLGPRTVPTHRDELVLGSAVHQPTAGPTAVIHVTDSGGGSGFDWAAASVGAASALGIVLIAGGAATGYRSRRGVAVS